MLRAGRRAEFLAELGKTPRQSSPISNDSATLAAIWQKFEQVAFCRYASSERATKRTIWLRHIEPTFGDRKVHQIQPLDIEAWRASLIDKSLSNKTTNNILSTIRVLLRWAANMGLIEASPAEDVELLKARQIESANFLSPTEAIVFIDWVKKNYPSHKRFPIELGLRGGLRYGELAALEKRDLNVSTGTIRVRQAVSLGRKGELEERKEPKGRRAGTVPIGRDFAKELFKWSLSHESQLLVPSPRGGRLVKATLWRWLERACREAGVSRISPHGLRHSCGTILAANGFSQAQIARFLRHRQISSSERYTHTGSLNEMVDGVWKGLEVAGSTEVGRDRVKLALVTSEQ